MIVGGILSSLSGGLVIALMIVVDLSSSRIQQAIPYFVDARRGWEGQELEAVAARQQLADKMLQRIKSQHFNVRNVNAWRFRPARWKLQHKHKDWNCICRVPPVLQQSPVYLAVILFRQATSGSASRAFSSGVGFSYQSITHVQKKNNKTFLRSFAVYIIWKYESRMTYFQPLHRFRFLPIKHVQVDHGNTK